MTARCSINLGLLSMEAGELDQAQGYLEEALSSVKQLNIKFDITNCLGCLGILFYFQEDTSKSKQAFKESLSLLKELDIHLQAHLLEGLFTVPHFRMSEHAVKLLGAVRSLQANDYSPKDAFLQRESAYGETQLRALLEESAFEAAFLEGQDMSIQEALDLALRMVEDM